MGLSALLVSGNNFREQSNYMSSISIESISSIGNYFLVQAIPDLEDVGRIIALANLYL